jgi:hypothetical protein
MTLRPEVRPLLVGGTLLLTAFVGGMLFYCWWRGVLAVHLATLAILTTSGPLIARVFEGLVKRRQRIRGLDMNSLEADDEVLVSRTVPLLMPIAGAAFSYWIMM